MPEPYSFMGVNMYQEKIIHLETNEETIRPYTAEEIEQVKLAQAEAIKKIEKANAQEVARQALLDRLGITADEAKLLLGA